MDGGWKSIGDDHRDKIGGFRKNSCLLTSKTLFFAKVGHDIKVGIDA